jgi:hypothetical protein
MKKGGKKMVKADKQADLAGPGVGTYEKVAKILPKDYEPLQTPMERMKTIYAVKEYIEKNLCKKIWKVLYGAAKQAQEQFPALRTDKYPDFPEKLQFFHAEEILNRYPDLPRKQRETKMLHFCDFLHILKVLNHPQKRTKIPLKNSPTTSCNIFSFTSSTNLT